VIIEIPDGEDFARASLNLLNLSWEIAVEFLRAYEHSSVIHPEDAPTELFTDLEGKVHLLGGPDNAFTPEERSTAETEFWRRSQPSLGNSLSLIQQSIELGLKGRIAAVSPFLLISRDARDYPSGSAKADVPFSAFRSLDAADLMRVHNTVCAERLDDSFGAWWDSIRRQRNALIHSVSLGAEIVRPEVLMGHILVANRDLHPGISWFQRRLRYSSNNEIQVAYHPDPREIYGGVLDEFGDALHYLPTKMVREHFGYNRRARTYTCIHCQDDCDNDLWYEWNLGKTAQLNPGNSTSTIWRCVLCERVTPVIRVRCPDEKCHSNVLSAELGDHYKICLTCGEEWGLSEEQDEALDAGD